MSLRDSWKQDHMKEQILNVNLKYELSEEGEFYAGNRGDRSRPFVSGMAAEWHRKICPSGVTLQCGLPVQHHVTLQLNTALPWEGVAWDGRSDPLNEKSHLSAIFRLDVSPVVYRFISNTMYPTKTNVLTCVCLYMCKHTHTHRYAHACQTGERYIISSAMAVPYWWFLCIVGQSIAANLRYTKLTMTYANPTQGKHPWESTVITIVSKVKLWPCW